MEQGGLVISLDFELLWGVFDKVNHLEKQAYFANTREVIPLILNLFEEMNISCTWAPVGMLFNSNWNEWNANFPEVLPNYENENLSAYNFGKSIQSVKTEALCFAPDLIHLIQETSKQELATHTYSHYYCLEPGQSSEAFRADIQKAKELIEKTGGKMQSLVFPRNQINSSYLEICENLGIQSVRSNPSNWYWANTQKDNLSTKIFRTGDAYWGRKNKSYPLTACTKAENNLLIQKASRLLRPYSDTKMLNNLKVQRIKTEMSYAAKRGEIYHLWWHPHNFGTHPTQSMEELKQLLQHYLACKNKYGFQSYTMQDIFIKTTRPHA